VDPTVQNRQGHDIGTQYQTGVYYTNEKAKETTERIAAIEKSKGGDFFVEIGPLRNFFTAEEYHQNYLEKNPDGYCHIPRNDMKLFAALRIEAEEYTKPASELIAEKLASDEYSHLRSLVK